MEHFTSSTLKIFGKIDLWEILNSCNGHISTKLIDAGMIRDREADYDYSISDYGHFLNIKQKGKLNQITIPRIVPITSKLLIFFGMYDGDGNKTGNIGFAQNNTELQTFAVEAIESIFPNTFKTRVNILESSLYFESEEMKELISNISSKIRAKTNVIPNIIDIQKMILQKEFIHSNKDIGDIDKISITISPKKGGEIKGRRSYEIILEKHQSRDFLPFLLFLIKKSIDEILGDDNSPGFYWEIKPDSGYFYCLDTERYLKSNRCRFPSSKSVMNGYKTLIKNDFLIMSKSRKKSLIKVHKIIPITPLLCLMFGIYWAEGTTTKKKLFNFRNNKESGIGVGFNSSENKSLQIFFSSMTSIFIDMKEIISCWLVKIGSKYHAEMSALASKIAVPVTRGGPGGDGIGRTLEITEISKQWALNQFPIMQKFENYFSHIEFTGAGIPRIDIRCRPTSAIFFFSFMVDLSFYEKLLRPFIIEVNSI